MSALSKIRSSRAVIALGPSPRAMAVAGACLSLATTVFGVAYTAYPLTADYFNRDVCDAPTQGEAPIDDEFAYDYGYGYYPVTEDTTCVSADQHRDLMFGIPTSVGIGIFVALFVVGIAALVAVTRYYTTPSNKGNHYKNVPGYDLVKRSAQLLGVGLIVIGAYFLFLLGMGLAEVVFSAFADMTSDADTSSF